jgi:hypothetical protein
MTVHTTAFEAEQPPRAIGARKLNLRKLLSTGAAV